MNAPGNPSNERGSRTPLFILLVVLVFLLLVGIYSHWDFTLIASPSNVTVTSEQKTPPPAPQQKPAPMEKQTPIPVIPIVEVPLVPPQATQPSSETKPSVIAPEPVVYVNVIIVDEESGLRQFPVFEKVLKSSMKRDGKMTEFTGSNGKRTTTYARVLESSTYTDDDIDQIGTISCPDKNNPEKMIVVRCNQSERNVYRDPRGMYYKTDANAVLPAPEQSTWFTRPISPH